MAIFMPRCATKNFTNYYSLLCISWFGSMNSQMLKKPKEQCQFGHLLTKYIIKFSLLNKILPKWEPLEKYPIQVAINSTDPLSNNYLLQTSGLCLRESIETHPANPHTDTGEGAVR